VPPLADLLFVFLVDLVLFLHNHLSGSNAHLFVGLQKQRGRTIILRTKQHLRTKKKNEVPTREESDSRMV